MRNSEEDSEFPNAVPFADESQMIVDLKYRMARILNHSNVPEELKKDFVENNLVQLFNKLSVQTEAAYWQTFFLNSPQNVLLAGLICNA